MERVQGQAAQPINLGDSEPRKAIAIEGDLVLLAHLAAQDGRLTSWVQVGLLGLLPAIEHGTEFGGTKLRLLGTEVPAGWARTRGEKIDVLAVDQFGRLVVVELKVVGDQHLPRLRQAVFQSLRYWSWAKRNQRALQVVYGRDNIQDVGATPALFIVNAGADIPEDVLRFRRAVKPEGLDVLLRFFQCPAPERVQELAETGAN